VPSLAPVTKALLLCSYTCRRGNARGKEQVPGAGSQVPRAIGIADCRLPIEDWSRKVTSEEQETGVRSQKSEARCRDYSRPRVIVEALEAGGLFEDAQGEDGEGKDAGAGLQVAAQSLLRVGK